MYDHEGAFKPSVSLREAFYRGRAVNLRRSGSLLSHNRPARRDGVRVEGSKRYEFFAVITRYIV